MLVLLLDICKLKCHILFGNVMITILTQVPLSHHETKVEKNEQKKREKRSAREEVGQVVAMEEEEEEGVITE